MLLQPRTGPSSFSKLGNNLSEGALLAAAGTVAAFWRSGVEKTVTNKNAALDIVILDMLRRPNLQLEVSSDTTRL